MTFLDKLKTYTELYTEVIPRAFGLDISDSSLKFMQLSIKGKSFSIDLYGEKPIEQGVVERGIIKDKEKLSEVIKKLRLEYKDAHLSKYVVSSLPDENTFLKTIKLPHAGFQELESTIVVEAERNIPLDVDSLYLDYYIFEENSKERTIRVLLAATQNTIVDSFIDSVVDAGLFPVVVEPEVSAIGRSVLNSTDKDKDILVIEIGANRTRLIAFINATVRVTGSVDFSANGINRLIPHALKIDLQPPQNLKWDKNLLSNPKYKSLKNILSVSFKSFSQAVGQNIESWNSGKDDGAITFFPQKIILSGGGALIPGFLESLNKNLKLPVEKANPLKNLFTKKEQKDLPIDTKTALLFSTALGLAHRGASLGEKSVYKDFT